MSQRKISINNNSGLFISSIENQTQTNVLAYDPENNKVTYMKSNSLGNSYFCQGRLNSNQSITNEDIAIQFVPDIDPNEWLYNYKFSPNVSGYYSITLQAMFSDVSGASGQNNCQISLNGNNTQHAIYQSVIPTNIGISLGGTKIVYLNGTTDFIQFTAYTDVVSSQFIKSSTGTYFNAVYLSS
jgi:hypothetical protein